MAGVVVVMWVPNDNNNCSLCSLGGPAAAMGQASRGTAGRRKAGITEPRDLKMNHVGYIECSICNGHERGVFSFALQRAGLHY